MHFFPLLTTALIAFTSTTSAGALHDRRTGSRLQMIRNRGPVLHARHNGEHPGGAVAPVSSAVAIAGDIVSTVTAIEGLNSTIGFNATATTPILESPASNIILTSETASVDGTACPPAFTVTITETVLDGGKAETGGESASIITTLTESADPALTTDGPLLNTTIAAIGSALPNTTDGAPPFTFIPDPSSPPPAPTEAAAIRDERPAPAPIPLQDGDVTTQIFTQTISSPAATLILESTIRRGRNRGKVVTITEESAESVGVETVTIVVTQEGRVELVTSESGVAAEPTAIVVDGIAEELPAGTESAALGEETGVAQTSALATDGNAAIETSTLCTDAGITITSEITLDAPSATASTAPELPDANENVVSMISVITLTKSAEPFITTIDIDGVPALTIVTPALELVLSTITLVDGGATGTGTDGVAPVETGGGRGNGRGRGKGRKKNKNKGGNGRGHGRGGDNDEDEDDDDENGAGQGNDRNQKNAGGRVRGNGRGSGEYGVDD